MAFLHLVTRKNKPSKWKVMWNDATKGEGRAGRTSADCVSGKHKEAFDAADLSPAERAALACGATNPQLREKLRRCYDDLEQEKKREAARAGGFGRGSRLSTKLTALIDEFLAESNDDVKVREAAGGKRGTAEKTHEARKEGLNRFREFLSEESLIAIATGELDANILKKYRAWMLRYVSKRTGKPLSAPSVNRDLRNVKAFIRRCGDDEDLRPYFRVSVQSLSNALKKAEEPDTNPEHFTPAKLQKLLETAWELDARSEVDVSRTKQHVGKVESFSQGHHFSPLFPWLVMLMLTGARRHELEMMRWDDVDLKNGTLEIRTKKTKQVCRWLRLVDSRGLISPGLLALLKKWRLAAPDAEYVLPTNGRDGTPTFPVKPWSELRKRAKIAVKPKALRSNWVSYAVCIRGWRVPEIAKMAGHSQQVLETNYHSFLDAREEGDSLDELMGIAGILRAALRDAGDEGELPNIAAGG